ncbi:hypothetical protein CSA56_18445 [candidate division KSB3 bacterium]|uniref:Uncharacterized protein n=1 Tax=candidate division KSB3 bacterium TaxID=2044937 RepID=A0A2G6K6R7_9BACT|nr:MAG: hypothetical protein CSA56_18445 [candidate division KSB3 bacterium]
MSIATNWLPDLVSAVIEKEKAGDVDAGRLQAKLCSMDLVERAVRPVGIKYLLRKRGLPIIPNTRRTPAAPCPLEMLRALDECAGMWFTANGELQST